MGGLLVYLASAVPLVNAQETIPEHEFMVERQKFTKENKIPKYHVTLIIGPYIFTRNRKATGIGLAEYYDFNYMSADEIL